jgi:hypothetical protein
VVVLSLHAASAIAATVARIERSFVVIGSTSSERAHASAATVRMAVRH